MIQDTQIVLPFARLAGKTLQADFHGGTLSQRWRCAFPSNWLRVLGRAEAHQYLVWGGVPR
jgi:hypothetical protein